MNFAMQPELEAFRAEVRIVLEGAVTPQLVRELRQTFIWGNRHPDDLGARTREFCRELGRHGLLTVTWPAAYGGRGGSPLHEFVISEELARKRVPHPSLEAALMIGPSILRYGTDEQKQEFLPAIAAGELQIAMGYTEPNAGSDLASLEMRAERDGDDYVISGEKVFNSACHFADYHWLSARTDPSVPKRHGISMFMVPLNSEGIDVRPIFTIPGGRTNAAHYDRVRVPASALVGELNHGWELITHAFSAERIYVVPVMELAMYFSDLLDHARKRPHLEPGLRVAVANASIELEVAKLHNYRALDVLTNGNDARVEASIAKIFQTELAQRLANLALAVLGPFGQLADGSDHVPAAGDLSMGYLACPMPTFGGGSSEVLRDLIATWGLGLPRDRA